jgi:competence protein ComEC
VRDAAPARHPAVAIALALGCGIACDHYWSARLELWLLVAALLALAWMVLVRFRFATQSAGVLLLCLICLGAARHHLCWSTAAGNDLSLFASDEPRLVRVVGTLLERPDVISREAGNKRSAWPHPDASTATLSVQRLSGDGDDLAVSGRALVHVNGHLVHCDVGDEVEVFGWLNSFAPAKNPGGFDPAAFYQRQGIRCMLRADHPDAVRLLHAGSPLSIWRCAARLRAEGEALFARDLSPRTGPVAAALLFGGRMQMDEEIRDAFTQSGLLHVLAISGMHVAILGVLLWGIGRLAGLSVRGTCALIIVGVLGYTILTDCNPPVIRATVMVCLYAGARFFLRRPALSNCLALSAVVILLWNPTDLFNTGTQLSFLAVLGIVWACGRRKKQDAPEIADAPETPSPLWTPIGKCADYVRRRSWDEWSISVAAALFTLPLVAARFHLVSPVGVLINVVLAPLSTLVLWCGYIHLGLGLLAPGVSWVAAVPFDLGLGALLYLVEWAAHVRLSHFYVPGPTEWWLAGYYLLLFLLAFVRPVRTWGSRGWSLLLAWIIVGLLWGLRTPNSDSLRCTFLSVGHGGAILIECPNGGTLLYDAGAMQDGRIAQRAVQQTLWDRRRHGLDALIVSHADMDHFNGAADLMQSLPVGSLLVSQQFLDFKQPAVAALCESTAACGVPIRLVRDGDRLRLDDGVEIRVLHPPFGRPHSDDNANSIVLSIEFAGRRILLTGDLEGHGQTTLLSTPPVAVDVLQSPHHGSRRANSAALAEWANPKELVISADARVDFKSLRAAFDAETRITSTDDAGAVTFEIHPDGTLERTTYVPEKHVR